MNQQLIRLLSCPPEVVIASVMDVEDLFQGILQNWILWKCGLTRNLISEAVNHNDYVGYLVDRDQLISDGVIDEEALRREVLALLWGK